jgi:Ca2+-binding EF-hand superfamily protein
MLDANGDGRLSPREMRTAWQRLGTFDRDGDGLISREEMPRQVQITINPGLPNLGVVQPGRIVPPRRTEPMVGNTPAGPRGPLWFRKMDLNGDGDVSRREWLGSPEEFSRIDTDGDGLISLEEAERYERRRNRN